MLRHSVVDRFMCWAIASMLSASALPAMAAECPVPESDLDRVERAIEAAPTCRAAFQIMNACRRNSSADVGYAGIVIDKCEKSFLTRGLSAKMRAYQDERAACRAQYARRQGTMYASFQATCEAGVAVKYAR